MTHSTIEYDVSVTSLIDQFYVVYRGIIVPGGFGARGTEGKILAAKYARERKIPYLG